MLEGKTNESLYLPSVCCTATTTFAYVEALERVVATAVTSAYEGY